MYGINMILFGLTFGLVMVPEVLYMNVFSSESNYILFPCVVSVSVLHSCIYIPVYNVWHIHTYCMFSLLLSGINGATLWQHPKKDRPQGWGGQCHGLRCLMGLWSQLIIQRLHHTQKLSKSHCVVLFWKIMMHSLNFPPPGLRSVFSPILWLLQQPACHWLAQVPYASVILPGWCRNSGL